MSLQFGPITYGPHGHRLRSEGTVNGHAVVVIQKHKNHTHTNSGVYSVSVRGVELDRRFRGIDEARQAGQEAYEAQAARS